MQTQTAIDVFDPMETLQAQTHSGVPGEGEPKTPATRLLDMLAGWSEFVQRGSSVEDAALSNEDVFDLHQEAGQL